MKFNNKFLFIFIFLTVFIYAGHPIAEAKESFKVLLSQKNKGYPKKYRKKLEHPYDISANLLNKIMLDLYYVSKKGGKGWHKEKRVFSNSLADRASVIIKKALIKANSKKKVILRKMGAKGETACDIFIKEQTIHFKFDKINGVSTIHNKWKMVPKLVQRYYKPSKSGFVASFLSGGRYSDTTWITIPLLEYSEVYQDEPKRQYTGKTVSKGKKEDQLPQTIRQSKIKQLNKMEKMKSLKATFESKLINRKEYRKKALDLLRSPTKVKMSLKDELLFLKILKHEGFISEDYYNKKKQVLLENL